MRFAQHLTLVVLALGVSVVPGQADIITLNYDFSASGFLPAGTPVDPVTGSFSVTFDNAIGNISDTTSGVSVTNLNITLGSVPAFSYFAIADMLTIGGLEGSPSGFSLPAQAISRSGF